jgi:HD-GYP domain-containing protein (c-di-GMP phosphodiesterase class II)
MTFSEVLAWSIAVLITDMQRHVLCYNEQWMDIYGVDRDDASIHHPSMMKSGLTARSVYEDLNARLQNQGAWSGVLVNRHLNEACYLVVSLTTMKLEVEEQWVYVSLHQPIEQLSVASASSIGSLQTVEGIFLQTMAKIAEWNDPELDAHVSRVSKLARWIAEIAHQAGMIPEKDIDLIEAASVVHDIGKAAVPKEMLFKPGRFTDAERAYVQHHAIVGGDMINTLYRNMKAFHHGYDKQFEYAMQSATTHHEWWNGHGYPKGLKGEEIPMVGRIVALADVVDALLSVRTYKKAWDESSVKEYVMHAKGKQFDPVLVDLMMANWEYRPR